MIVDMMLYLRLANKQIGFYILKEGSSLYPVSVITGHVAMRTHVRILMGPVATGHWTEVGPLKEKETFSTISCINNLVKIFES